MEHDRPPDRPADAADGVRATPALPPGDAAGDVWQALARWRSERRRCVLATVTDSRGFTPRKPGTHLLISEGGDSVGTIGGGAIEQQVIAQAVTLLGSGGAVLLKRHLTQELGMCCGGAMTVFLEVIEAAPRLVVYGAGHIARPLAAMAGRCGFEVTVVDEREEWASAARFPDARRVVAAADEHARALVTTLDDFAVVVTHDHALDQVLVQHLLARPLRFLGMIGSVAKQRKFALRLRARGFSDADLARLHCPLGVAIGAQTPEEIAVSVLAELIAARRGTRVDDGWTPPASRAGLAERPAQRADAVERPASRADAAGRPAWHAEAAAPPAAGASAPWEPR